MRNAIRSALMTSQSSWKRRHSRIAAFVILLQFVLTPALFLLPHRPACGDLWQTPQWLATGLLGIQLVSLVAVFVAFSGLGDALTPSPKPRTSATLHTDGIYRYVRHPIYAAWFIIVGTQVIRIGSIPGIALGVAIITLFRAKALWEERLLQERFPDYVHYSKRTPRFFPHIRSPKRH